MRLLFELPEQIFTNFSKGAHCAITKRAEIDQSNSTICR